MIDPRIVLLLAPVVGPAAVSAVFCALKATGLVSWPWMACLAPIWLWMGAVLALLAVAGSVILLLLHLEQAQEDEP